MIAGLAVTAWVLARPGASLLRTTRKLRGATWLEPMLDRAMLALVLWALLRDVGPSLECLCN